MPAQIPALQRVFDRVIGADDWNALEDELPAGAFARPSMSGTRFDAGGKGFAGIPQLDKAPDGGVELFRCFDGVNSTEWGTGYFSLEKPESVVDAEMRFNIAEWGNLIRYVSTFRLKAGFHYYKGAVEHGPRDLSRAATQVYVEPPLAIKLELISSRELLKHDAVVISNPDPGAARSS